MDELYIQKVLSGETDAFRYFIKKYKDIGYSLAISVVKNEFDAQEVLQASFISAFEGLAAFKGKSKFSTWFYRILINEAFKALKKQDKEIRIDLESCVNKVTERNDFNLKIEKEDQRHYINEALKKLPSNESLSLRLFYLEECSIEEISQITGWTLSNIKVTLHRARMHMRQQLKECFNLDKQALYQ